MPEFVGTCVHLSADDLHAYDDSEREITYHTFVKHLGRELIQEINRWSGVPVGRDKHVSFGKGKWRGKPCVCLHHSAIHHIWTL